MPDEEISKKKRGNLFYKWICFKGGQSVIYEYEEERVNGFFFKEKNKKEWKFGNEEKAKQFWEKL